VRIRAITPIHVGPDELARRQQRYDRLSPPGLTVSLVDLPSDAPQALETAEDVRTSEQLVVDHARAVPADEYDVVLPDCVLDPGVGVAHTEVPLVGILRLSTSLLAATGRRFSAVARNAAIAAELERKAAEYGLSGLLTQVRVLGLDVASIPDDASWGRAVAAAVADLPGDVVVNGCSAVDVSPADGPVVLDPTATALQVLGLLSTTGLRPSAGSVALA
jgi:Asp/Glu/hydantoin racemase